MNRFEQGGFISQQLDTPTLLRDLADEHDYEIEADARISKEHMVQPETLFVDDIRVSCYELLKDNTLALHYSIGTNRAQRLTGVVTVPNRLEVAAQ